MKRLLLLITGMPGSGKSAAADMIAKRYDAKVYHSGDIIREEVKRGKLPYTPASDKKVAEWFHRAGRTKLLTERVWDKVKRTRKKIILIEGFRDPESVKYIEELSGLKPMIVEVKAPFRINLSEWGEQERRNRKRSMAKYCRSSPKGRLSLRALLSKRCLTEAAIFFVPPLLI